MEGHHPEIGEQSVLKLLDTLDNYFKVPERVVSDEPIFGIEKLYTIKGFFFNFLIFKKLF